MQELVNRIEGLESKLKEIKIQLEEKHVEHKQVFYEKSTLSNWNISEATARRHIKDGLLTAYKYGRKIYVDVRELEERIAEGKILVATRA